MNHTEPANESFAGKWGRPIQITKKYHNLAQYKEHTVVSLHKIPIVFIVPNFFKRLLKV